MYVHVFFLGVFLDLIQFTKKIMLAKDAKTSIEPARRVSKEELKRLREEAEQERIRRERIMEEMAMEVAADDDQPFPAPYREKDWWGHAMEHLKKEKQPCGVAKVVS